MRCGAAATMAMASPPIMRISCRRRRAYSLAGMSMQSMPRVAGRSLRRTAFMAQQEHGHAHVFEDLSEGVLVFLRLAGLIAETGDAAEVAQHVAAVVGKALLRVARSQAEAAQEAAAPPRQRIHTLLHGDVVAGQQRREAHFRIV